MDDQGSAERVADEAELAVRIAGADAAQARAAEADFYRRMAPRVRLYGLKHLRDEHAAADLVQQVMMTTIEKLRVGALRDTRQVVSFVFGTCRMVVLDLRRGRLHRNPLRGRGDALPPGDLVQLVARVAAGDTLAGLVASLEPQLSQYRNLRALLARYRRVAGDATLGRLPPGAPVHPGDPYAALARLERWLAAYGDLAPDSAAGTDSGLYRGRSWRRCSGSRRATRSPPTGCWARPPWRR